MYRVIPRACVRRAFALSQSGQASVALRSSADRTWSSPSSSAAASLVQSQQPVLHPLQRRNYSADPSKRPSFIGNLLQNLKDEYAKNKDLKDNLEKFREEAKKLEESDALKEARRKFQNIESEIDKSKKASALKEQLSGIADKVKDTVDDVAKSEAIKKASEFTETLGKSTEGARKTIGDAAESISKSGAFQTVTSTASTIKEEIEGSSLGGKVYRPPKKLRKRHEYSYKDDEKPVEANEDATGVELHKDSKFFASWQNFKDNNPVVNKFVDYRVKYEESDNPVVRSARILTDKVQDIVGGLFTRTELSQVLTEIIKMDPNFEKEQFLKDCEKDIIPNILEAMIRGDLEILEDWCYEAPYSIIATPIKQARKMGYYLDSKVLDIDNVDLQMGKIMEQGPVLVITFISQQIMCVRDGVGKVVEGSDEKVMRVNYVWVLCRDQTELDPRAAWRLLEMAAHSGEQFF